MAGGLTPVAKMGSPSARRHSSSPIASTDRRFASSSSTSERDPGQSRANSMDNWHCAGINRLHGLGE